MLKNRLALAFAWLFFGFLAPGEAADSNLVAPLGSSFIIDSWTIDDGLPQNSVTSIIQTHDGYLWFGTRYGLVRFDGLKFAVFDEGNTPGLNSSGIYRLFEDREHNLWVGTETAGVVLIKNGQVTSLGIGQGSFEKRLASACQDARGAVWLYTVNGELWRYENGRLHCFLFDLAPFITCRLVMAEPAGPVWVGTDWHQAAIGPITDAGSLELPVTQDFSPKTNKLEYLLASPRWGGYWRLANGHVQKCRANQVERDWGECHWTKPVSAACEDRQGNLVVGTLGEGVFWYNANGQYARVSSEQGLTNNFVLSLCADREGNLWVGTDGGGLNRVKRQVFDVLDVAQGSFDRAVQSVCEDNEGGIWMGSQSGGVTRWKEGALQRYGFSQSLASQLVWTVFVDLRQRVWAGTLGAGLFQLQDGLFRRAAGSEDVNPRIHALYQDLQGRLWVGTQGGLAVWDEKNWTIYSTQQGLSANDVQALADDRAGNLWIGTVGGGLSCLRDGHFTAYHKKDGLPSEDVTALYVDGEDVLWIGTSGGGLGRWQAGKWTRYTTREGLKSNNITYLIEDGLGCLWMGSVTGIMRARKQELNDFAQGGSTFISCRVYRKPARECTQGSQPAGVHSRQGKLWFPTVRGLVSVDPAQLTPNTNPPPVIIESVLINGQPVNTNALLVGLPQPVVVPPGKERLDIHYTSLNLGAPDKGRFKYRLEPHETEWTEDVDSRVARYNRLPPGLYRFQVQACNEDGVWNKTGSAIEILVKTPYWRTGWFLGISTICLLGIIVGVVHYLSTQKLQRQLVRLEHQEALEKERARIAQDIHDQLGASLTQVSMLGELVESDKDHPAEVEAHARQIAQTARETTRVLDEIVWAVNPSNDTLEGLMTYICKYAQDFLAMANLRYRLDMPEQLPHQVLPPQFRHHVFLTFKEALTNVVRHAAASAVWVRLRLEPSTFILEIEDNGRGVAQLDEKAARARNGLRGMRRRMESIGGSFALGPAPEKGALVRLIAPLSP